MKPDCWIRKDSRRWRARKEIFGCAGQARRLGIGRGPRQQRALLLMVGCAPATFIGRTRTDFGFIWAVRMIASSRAVSGFRRLKSKECCYVTKASEAPRW